MMTIVVTTVIIAIFLNTKNMTANNWQTKAIGAIAIASLLLTACNQQPPLSDRQTPANPAITTAPNNNTSATTPNGDRVLNADDAAERVGDILDKDPTLKAFDLDADDEGNTIVLTGRVQNASQKQLAQTLSQQVAAGFSIVNRIVF
jgi:hypothetical protein